MKGWLEKNGPAGALLLIAFSLVPGAASAYFATFGVGTGGTPVGSDFALTRAVDRLTTAAILGVLVNYSTLAPAITETSSTMNGISGSSAIENPSGQESTSATYLLDQLRTPYAEMMALPSNAQISGDLNGMTLVPGVYFDSGALNMAASGVLTLDGRGDSNSLFVFQVTGAVGIGAGSLIKLTNGAQANHVYWVTTGAFGGGAGSALVGNVIAQGAANPGAGSTLTGRLLSLAAITITSVTITTPRQS